MVTIVADEVYFRASDNLVEWLNMKDKDDVAVTTATVTAKLLKAGIEVTGSSISVPHVANGNYEGTIQDTVTVLDKDDLELEVKADNGGVIRVVVLNVRVTKGLS